MVRKAEHANVRVVPNLLLRVVSVAFQATRGALGPTRPGRAAIVRQTAQIDGDGVLRVSQAVEVPLLVHAAAVDHVGPAARHEDDIHVVGRQRVGKPCADDFFHA